MHRAFRRSESTHIWMSILETVVYTKRKKVILFDLLLADLRKIALIGSPTRPPLLPEITAWKNHQRDQKKRKRIVPLHLIHPGYPGRYDPGGESGHLANSIFQGLMRIRLELTSDPGGWSGRHRSIPSLLSIRSIPSQQPMRIHLGSISGTKLTLEGFINRPKEAESRNPPNDLVETTSLDHLPPSALNGLVETTSPGPHHIPELAKALTQS